MISFMIESSLYSLRLRGFCLCLLQRCRQLVGTGGLFHAAVDAVQPLDDGIDVHPLDKLGDPLQVAVAAADEFDIPDGLAVDVKQDLLRAGASGSVGKMHDGFSFYSVRSLTDGLRFQFSVPDAEHLGEAV